MALVHQIHVDVRTFTEAIALTCRDGTGRYTRVPPANRNTGPPGGGLASHLITLQQRVTRRTSLCLMQPRDLSRVKEQ